MLPCMNSVALGKPFVRKYGVEIMPGGNMPEIPEMTSELTEVKAPSEGRKNFSQKTLPICGQPESHKPQNPEIVQTKVDFRKSSEGHNGTIIPDEEIYIPEETS